MRLVTVGVDPSLSCTGLVAVDETCCIVKRQRLMPESHHKGMKQLAVLKQGFVAFMTELLADPEVELVGFVAEAPYFGSVTKSNSLWYWHGILRMTILEIGKGNSVDIPPTSLKLFFCGHGQAEKRDMVAQALSWTGVKLSEDEADAFALAVAGQCLWLHDKPRGMEWCPKRVKKIAKTATQTVFRWDGENP